MYGQEHAYILPNKNQNPLDLFLQLKQYNDEQARYKDQQEREQRRYRDGLLAQAMGQLDFKHFASGTPLDPVIHSSLGNALKSVSQKIMENPDVSSASVYYDVANAVNDISDYAEKARNIRTNVGALAKEFAKNPSIDAAKLNQLALTNAFMKYDPQSHSFTVKDPSEIDDQTDWVSETLNNNPDQVVKGSAALDALLKNADKKVYENEYSVDKGGVSRKVAYKGEYFPYNKLELDASGRPMLDEKGVPKVGIRYENFNGIPLATKEDEAYFTSDVGANAYLNSLVKKAGLDPTTIEGQNLKLVFLYDHLNKNNQGFINKTKDEVDASQLQSENFRRDMKAIAEANKQNGSGSKDVQVQDVYGEIEEVGKDKKYGIPLSSLSSTSQGVLLDHAKRLLPSKDKNGNQISYGMGDVYIAKSGDGKYYLARTKKSGVMPTSVAKEDIISPLDKRSANTLRGVNNTLKERQSVLNSTQQFTGVPKGGF